MIAIWNLVSLIKEVYAKIMLPISERFNLTLTELNVILFLANNPDCDTATDIVEKRHIKKSHVSMSLKSLEAKNFIQRSYKDNNRRTIYLSLTEAADEVIKQGRAGQKHFVETMLAGLDDNEREQMEYYFAKIMDNMEQFTLGGNK